MKSIEERFVLQAPIDEVWNILSDISRCDWLPTVNHVEVEGDCRVFEMEGMGKIKEKIIEVNDENKTLKYSAIETRTPIDHHLACMQLNAIDDTSTELLWSTEIEPEIFAEAIRQGMLVSAEGLKKVLVER
jgi:carbon monoxide dehydrogenase subunit G